MKELFTDGYTILFLVIGSFFLSLIIHYFKVKKNEQTKLMVPIRTEIDNERDRIIYFYEDESKYIQYLDRMEFYDSKGNLVKTFIEAEKQDARE